MVLPMSAIISAVWYCWIWLTQTTRWRCLSSILPRVSTAPGLTTVTSTATRNLEGPNVFSGSFPVPESLETGSYPLHAWMEDDSGAVYPLNGMLEVLLDQPTAVVEDARTGRPAPPELVQNFPNPFNSETAIRFALAKSGTIDLAIYNTAGQ